MMTDATEGEVQRSLGRLEGKLDALIASTLASSSDLHTIEKRVAKLENWKAWIGGAVAVLGIISGGLVTLLVDVLRHAR